MLRQRRARIARTHRRQVLDRTSRPGGRAGEAPTPAPRPPGPQRASRARRVRMESLPAPRSAGARAPATAANPPLVQRRVGRGGQGKFVSRLEAPSNSCDAGTVAAIARVDDVVLVAPRPL